MDPTKNFEDEELRSPMDPTSLLLAQAIALAAAQQGQLSPPADDDGADASSEDGSSEESSGEDAASEDGSSEESSSEESSAASDASKARELVELCAANPCIITAGCVEAAGRWIENDPTALTDMVRAVCAGDAGWQANELRDSTKQLAELRADSPGRAVREEQLRRRIIMAGQAACGAGNPTTAQACLMVLTMWNDVAWNDAWAA